MSGPGKPLFDFDEIEAVLRRAKHDRWRAAYTLIAARRSNATQSVRVSRRSAGLVAGALVILTGAVVSQLV